MFPLLLLLLVFSRLDLTLMRYFQSRSYFHAYAALIGNEDACGINLGVEMKTTEEISKIAEQPGSFIMLPVTINLMYVHCYYREYLQCADLAEKYHKTQPAKRTFDFFLHFYMGICEYLLYFYCRCTSDCCHPLPLHNTTTNNAAALVLARDTQEDKWRKIGETSLTSMDRLAQCSTWNFENKRMLLQAELYSLDGRRNMAELAYQSSIVSAHDHKFIHEQALACELYGVFLVENKNVQGGMKQLQIAHDQYKQWGALKKVSDVIDLMTLVSSSACSL